MQLWGTKTDAHAVSHHGILTTQRSKTATEVWCSLGKLHLKGAHLLRDPSWHLPAGVPV